MKDRGVLDASGAMQMLLDQELATKIHSTFSTIFSPPLFKFEIGNICWKYVRFSHWSKEKAEGFLERAIELTIEFEEIQESHILKNAIKTNLSFYDSTYFTLAEITNSTLISKDKKLNKVANDSGIDIYF